MITNTKKYNEKSASIIKDTEINSICGTVENGVIKTPGTLDSSITYASKKAFIDEISATNIGQGVTNWVAKEKYIKLIILQNIENKLSKKRRFDITGDQINKTTGTLRIEAVKPESLRIDMTDGGIIIDAGSEDITVKCNHFYIKNTSEDNITYGDDYYEHHGKADDYFYGDKYEEHHGKATGYFYGEKYDEHRGKATEKFYGKKYDYHYGDMEEHFEGHKKSVHGGTAEDYFAGNRFELFLGGHESITPIANTFEFYGGFKEEITLAAAIAVGMGLAVDIKLGFTADLNMSVCIAETKALKWDQTGGLKGDKARARIGHALLSVIGGGFCFNNYKLKLE